MLRLRGRVWSELKENLPERIVAHLPNVRNVSGIMT